MKKGKRKSEWSIQGRVRGNGIEKTEKEKERSRREKEEKKENRSRRHGREAEKPQLDGE